MADGNTYYGCVACGDTYSKFWQLSNHIHFKHVHVNLRECAKHKVAMCKHMGLVADNPQSPTGWYEPVADANARFTWRPTAAVRGE